MVTERNQTAPWSSGVTLVLTGLFVACVLGCGKTDGIERCRAAGQVFLNGERVSNASIVFEPQDGGGIRVSAPIVDGLFAFTEENGPTVGEFNVRINPDAVEDSEALGLMQQQQGDEIVLLDVPQYYQRAGAMTATVTAEGPNNFAFNLTSN